MVILVNNSLIPKMLWSVVSRPFVSEPVSLRPVCDRIPPFPAEGLLHAMAFDGEVYDKSAFFSYYDDAAFHVWNECQVRTHAAASFVHIWFNWTLQ